MTNYNFLSFLKKGKVLSLFISVVFMCSCTQKNNLSNAETDLKKNKIVSAANDTSTINNSAVKTKLSCCKSPSRMKAFTQAHK